MGTQLFDQVIGELPPSTVDVAGIVRREKRRRARQVTGVATAVVALSVASALGLSMTGGPGASSPPEAGRSAAAGGTGAVPDTRFALVAVTEETAAASAKRLSQTLGDALRKQAPGARWITEPGVEGRDTPDGRPPILTYRAGKDETKAQELFGGGQGLLNQGRKGSLHLGVEPAVGLGEDGLPRHNNLECPSAASLAGTPGDAFRRTCTVTKAPSGTKMLFESWGDGDAATICYDMALPDGRILRIMVSNTFGAQGGGAVQKDTPLTAQQLKAITVDVAGRIKA
jgi:hypothetical protein